MDSIAPGETVVLLPMPRSRKQSEMLCGSSYRCQLEPEQNLADILGLKGALGKWKNRNVCNIPCPSRHLFLVPLSLAVFRVYAVSSSATLLILLRNHANKPETSFFYGCGFVSLPLELVAPAEYSGTLD